MGTKARAVLQEHQGRTIARYQTEYRDENREYGADELGKVRAKIGGITPGKPYDLAESKADSDKVTALLILELNDQGLVSADLADVAASMLHGKSRAATMTVVKQRFEELDLIVQGE